MATKNKVKNGVINYGFDNLNFETYTSQCTQQKENCCPHESPPLAGRERTQQKVKFTHWELNPGPSPRQGDVITATLWVNKQVVRA